MAEERLNALAMLSIQKNLIRDSVDFSRNVIQLLILRIGELNSSTTSNVDEYECKPCYEPRQLFAFIFMANGTIKSYALLISSLMQLVTEFTPFNV